MILKALLKYCALPSAALLAMTPVQADWSLDNDRSTLSFVTIKADHVAEVHTFDVLSGSVADNGDVEIAVELASVNTLIDIRNERMQAMLFETGLFPEAGITANVDIDGLAELDVGSTQAVQIAFQLDLHGQSNSYTADVLVSRLEGGIVAATIKPVVVTADSYALVTGVEALREIAGLPSISRAVPVSFVVVFEQDQ
jgi:polyisoprenoid-binding protein YceI